MINIKEFLRGLPKVDPLLESRKAKELSEQFTRERVKLALRESLAFFRKSILDNNIQKFISENDILCMCEEILQKQFKKTYKVVVNATGIVIHTNLGRSILSDNATNAILEVAKNYTTLEYDINTGKRGSRYSHVEEMIKELTGAQSCLVVNNNAAAVMLILNEFSKNKEAIISRGELVEIGGNFRIPDVMEYAGAILKEVGTTNRTHIKDYENAINENTGVLLKIHSSNYKIIGFTKEVSSLELSNLGKSYNITTYEDLGSGALIPIKTDIEKKTIKDSIIAGIDIVSFSGDKLLGGPQAGIIVGKKEFIDRVKKNPLTRALRVDKLTLAALWGTLLDYLSPNREDVIPTLNMINKSSDEILNNATELYNLLSSLTIYKFEIEKDITFVGGGAMPGQEFETYTIQTDYKIIEVEKCLRKRIIPIIVRLKKNKLVLDLRTIRKAEFKIIYDAFKEVGEIL